MPAKKDKAQFSPISLRVSLEEKTRLESDAGNMTVSAYIRAQLFGKHVASRKRRMRRPAKDYRTIAQLFALIKQTSMLDRKGVSNEMGFKLELDFT